MAGDEAVGGDSDGFVGGEFALRPEHHFRRRVPVEDPPGIFLERRAFRSERDGAFSPEEQFRAEALLKLRNVLADSRLRHTKRLGGQSEAALLGHRHEYSQSEILQNPFPVTFCRHIHKISQFCEYNQRG